METLFFILLALLVPVFTVLPLLINWYRAHQHTVAVVKIFGHPVNEEFVVGSGGDKVVASYSTSNNWRVPSRLVFKISGLGLGSFEYAREDCSSWFDRCFTNLLNDLNVSKALSSLLDLGFLKIEFLNGNLLAIWPKYDPQVSPIDVFSDQAVADIQKIADGIRLYFTAEDMQSGVELQKKFYGLGLGNIICVGPLLVFTSILLSSNYILDLPKVFGYVALPVLVLAFVFNDWFSKYAKQCTKLQKIRPLILSTFTVNLGCLFVFAISGFNIALPQQSTETRTINVTRFVHHFRAGKGGGSYYTVRADDWSRPGKEFDFFLDVKGQAVNKVQVTLNRGAAGINWIPKYTLLSE